MFNVFIESTASNLQQAIKVSTYEELSECVKSLVGTLFWLLDRCTGKTVNPRTSLYNDMYISIRFKLLGGKGGFGSQLRAQGNKMSSKKRAGGYEACRSLETGSRIRTINETRAIQQYLDSKQEILFQKESEIESKMAEKLAIKEKKIFFADPEFERMQKKCTSEVELATSEMIKMKKKKHSIEEPINERKDS